MSSVLLLVRPVEGGGVLIIGDTLYTRPHSERKRNSTTSLIAPTIKGEVNRPTFVGQLFFVRLFLTK